MREASGCFTSCTRVFPSFLSKLGIVLWQSDDLKSHDIWQSDNLKSHDICCPNFLLMFEGHESWQHLVMISSSPSFSTVASPYLQKYISWGYFHITLQRYNSNDCWHWHIISFAKSKAAIFLLIKIVNLWMWQLVVFMIQTPILHT